MHETRRSVRMRSTAFLRALLSTAFLAAALPAVAQQAAPADRCEGTICDLYYGNSAPSSAKPQATSAQPLPTAPTGGILSFFTGGARPAAAPQPTQQVVAEPGSGGLVAMMKGAASDRCTGTLCDLYYGGPPPQHPVAAAAPVTTISAEPVATADASAPAVEYVPEREEPKHCVSPANDPWRCYRR